jgi:hypothetical protein
MARLGRSPLLPSLLPSLLTASAATASLLLLLGCAGSEAPSVDGLDALDDSPLTQSGDPGKADALAGAALGAHFLPFHTVSVAQTKVPVSGENWTDRTDIFSSRDSFERIVAGTYYDAAVLGWERAQREDRAVGVFYKDGVLATATLTFQPGFAQVDFRLDPLAGRAQPIEVVTEGPEASGANDLHADSGLIFILDDNSWVNLLTGSGTVQ